MKKLSLIIITLFSINLVQSQEVEKKIKEITDTSVKPYNKICFQQITRNKILIWGGSKVSTGFFIDRNFILTAAHNVHSQFLSNVKEIKIKIGRSGDSQLFNTITISGKNLVSKHVRTPEKYGLRKRMKKRRNWDFALIYIPDSLLPSDFKWENEFTLPQKSSNKEKNIKVAGYPADSEEGFDGSKLFYQMGQIDIKDKYYKHDFLTAGGNSGSPVWFEVDKKNTILGIHTFSGSGTLLDDEDLKIIRNWMVELKSMN